MNTENTFAVQNQIRENSEDVQSILRELDNWEKEMRKKEQELKLVQTTEEDDVPPVRNTLSRSKKKNKHKKTIEKISPSDNRISAYDYKAWEKFDVDSELKKMDNEKKESSASDSSEKEEELCLQKKKQLAIIKKDKGNEFFKKGNFDSAINSYTIGMELDPENPLLPANRAMAFLKKEQFQAAENDCTVCLSLDPTYVKAYLRRGTARKALNKTSLAKEDFLKVLELEPDNKQAQSELEKSQENFGKVEVTNHSQNIFKTASEKKDDAPCNKFGNETDNTTSEIEMKLQDKSEEQIKNKLTEQNFCDEIKDIIAKLEQSLPPVPSTSYQFLSDWKKLSKYPDLRYQYLKQFPPEKFPVIFRHSMEAEIFPGILKVLSTSFIEKGDDVFCYLKSLAMVGRFNTMLLFLSDNEKEDIGKLEKYVRISSHEPSEIENILRLFKF